MRIGLNATCFNDRPSGANQRFFSLYREVIGQNPDIEFLIYEPADYPAARRFAGASNAVPRRTPLPSARRLERAVRGALFWPSALRADRVDLFETFSLPVPPALPCPLMLTVHDLRPLGSGEPWLLRRAANLVMRHAFARADHVLTVSETMRREILAFRAGTPVSVVSNGIDASGFAVARANARAMVRERWNLPEAFLLTVGHIEARKNMGLLVEAIAALRQRGLSRPLVIAGRDGGQLPSLRRSIAALELGDLVTIIEDADDDAVRALYALCRLVVVPSRYEGFGIPLLEAMAARRPLVTSDIPVFAELTEGKGIVFPSDDALAAAAAMERVWSDPAEQARLISHGVERVKDFGFGGPAQRIGALYRAVMESAAAMRSRAAAKEWKPS